MIDFPSWRQAGRPASGVLDLYPAGPFRFYRMCDGDPPEFADTPRSFRGPSRRRSAGRAGLVFGTARSPS